MWNNKELYKYIFSFILGDGGVYIDKRDWGTVGANAWFQSTKTEKNLDLLEKEKLVLDEITSNKIIRFDGHPAIIQGKETYTKPFYRLISSRHPVFSEFRRRLYPNGIKVLDPHYLKLFDKESLAILFMDDGTTSKKQYGCNVELCTQNFCYGDNLLLKKHIKDTLDLEFNVTQRNYKTKVMYSLVLRTKDQERFVNLVSEFITPSFEYKINTINESKTNHNRLSPSLEG